MIVLVNECFSKIYLVSAAILKQNLQKNHLQFSHSTGIRCLFWVWSAPYHLFAILKGLCKYLRLKTEFNFMWTTECHS